MSQLSTAGRLLSDLHRVSPELRDSVANAAGIVAERADAAMNGTMHLSLSEQLRLAETAILLAPRCSRLAFRLRGQVLAARVFESGDTETHSESPVGRWERSAQLRQ